MFSRRQFFQFLGGLGVFGASTTAYGFAEPVTRLGVTRYDIQPPQWPADFQLKIAAVADIHACDPWMSLPHIEAIVERMLEPHGLKTGDYDYVFAGATSARFAALKSGAVDAALLTVPFNFYAETAGYTNLGFPFDYLPDMPFAGMAVNRDWAAANGDVLKRFLDAYNKGVTWFDDPANHEAAVKLQMEVSKIGQDDVEKAYAFLRGKNLFEPTGKVSKRKVNNVIDALHALGDLPADFTVDRLLLPGVTQISD